MNQYRWEVEQRDGKWFCCGYSYERVGRLEIGNTEPVECHEFTTEWAAKAQQRFCVRLQEDKFALAVLPWASKYGTGIATASHVNSFEWRLGNLTVLTIDQRNELLGFDLPYLVWCWIKTTAVARGLRAFWYGWGQKPSHQ